MDLYKLIKSSNDAEKDPDAKLLCEFQLFHCWKAERDLKNIRCISITVCIITKDMKSLGLCYKNGEFVHAKIRCAINKETPVPVFIGRGSGTSLWFNRVLLELYNHAFNCYNAHLARSEALPIFDHEINKMGEHLILNKPQCKEALTKIDVDRFIERALWIYLANLRCYMDKEAQIPVKINSNAICVKYIAFSRVSFQ